jgi:hypothetical protein
MKALIFEGKIVQLADKEFPVAPSMHWAEMPEEMDPSLTKVEIEDIFEEVEELDEKTGENKTLRVFKEKKFHFLPDEEKLAEKALEEAERVKEQAKKQAMQTLINKLKNSNAQGPLKDLIDLYLMERGALEQDEKEVS